jgi:hypothetical protein
MATRTDKKENWVDGSCLVNDDRDSITHKAAESFINKIQEERHKGYGFVPFVGAGFSAPSGAPLVSELESYLQRCICMTLGVEEKGMEAWDPRTDQWPPFIDRHRTEKTRYAPKYWLEQIRKELPSLKDPKFALFAQGLGAAAEWRTALLFLSRVDRPPRGTGEMRPQPVSLVAAQQESIDSCFREVLKEKYPALGHKMLAVLAGALRLDLVLTTNFDDLLERAFAEARNPLEVCEVHLGSSLPHWSAVSDVRTLIKLHGNRYSLRADYSLDELPSEPDKKRFLEYLLSGKGRSTLAHDPKALGLDFQNHLLVMGASVKDLRTRAFIEYAWQHLREDFKVFWLCYAKDDVEQIQYVTKGFCKDRGSREHSIILRQTDFGLFLLQLYQTIRKNLPPLGSLFPSVSRLTVPPLPSIYVSKQKSAPKAKDSVCDKVRERLAEFQEDGFCKPKLVVVTSKDNVGGVTSACSEIYREMEAHNICLWMDMNDISSTDNLFEVLLEAAYFRLGLENWTPLYIASDERPRGDEIRRLVRSVAKPWVIFLNARETPGVNTTNDRVIQPNGWLDVRRNYLRPVAADRSPCMEEFLELLWELCGEQSEAISVVLMCRNSPPSPLIEKLDKESIRLVVLGKDSKERVKFSQETVAANAIAWTEGKPHKQRFLHALVLMQRPRLLATIWSSAVSLSGDRPADPLDEAKWVNELEERGLLRRKAGGFIWIHSRCRQFIRKLLGKRHGFRETREFLEKRPEIENALRRWDPKAYEPKIHGKLAEWYVKVLDASESPAAVFEAVYHLCRAAETSLKLGKDKTSLACERLEAAAALLKTNGFLIQTRGYSRGSCRHLEYIRDTLCKSIREKFTQGSGALLTAIQRLQIVCTEVMRMIAREVGEDTMLYRQHRQFGILLAKGKWEPEDEKECKLATYSISKTLYEKLSAHAMPIASEKYINNPNVEWLRWWRWSGMLGIASRSFPVAESALENGLRYATQSIDQYPASKEKIDWASLLERGNFKIFGSSLRDAQLQELLEVLRIIEQYVELLLLKDGVANRLRVLNIPVDPPEEVREKVKIIERHIAAGQKLISEIRSRDHSSDSHSTISANWCEGRLLMHQSACAARRVQLASGNQDAVLQTAMALLGDAEAGLRVSDPRRSRSELSMIELHRADARLHHAESVPIYERPKKTSMSFAEMCRTLELTQLESSWGEQGEDLLVKFLTPDRNSGRKLKPDVAEALHRAKSLVIDSMRFLNRAEPVLRARRRNVWWTTWFFERRLRAVALSVWASVFEIDTPIPFLGLEAAMRKTDTIADTLLEDAIRMIRVDAYRLATIVDAYASCAKALQTRLILDRKTVRLKERQLWMHEKLVSALEALEEVERRRNKLDAEKWEEDGRMGEDVQSYVNTVRERAGMIAEQVKYPILN